MLRLQRILRISSGSLRKRDAADQIAEAGKILGRGVKNQVRAQIERMLEGRAEQRVIHHDQRLVRRALRRHRRRAADIGHDQRGIGGRFDQDDAQILRRRESLRRSSRSARLQRRSRRRPNGSRKFSIRDCVPP